MGPTEGGFSQRILGQQRDAFERAVGNMVHSHVALSPACHEESSFSPPIFSFSKCSAKATEPADSKASDRRAPDHFIPTSWFSSGFCYHDGNLISRTALNNWALGLKRNQNTQFNLVQKSSLTLITIHSDQGSIGIQQSGFRCVGDANDAILAFTHFLIAWMLNICLQSREMSALFKKRDMLKCSYSDQNKVWENLSYDDLSWS